MTSTFSPTERRTRIEVHEEYTISDRVVDGYLEPDTAVTLPDRWVTGRGLSWSANGSPPPQLNTVDLYYIIRDNDREFRLAPTREAALAGVSTIYRQRQGSINNTLEGYSTHSLHFLQDT